MRATGYKSKPSLRKSDYRPPVRSEDDEQPIIDVDPSTPHQAVPRSHFRPTPSQRVMVAALSACNVGHDGIASYIRVNEQTLNRHFRYEIAEGYDRTEAALVGVVVAKALGGNMTAANTLLKCVFGWSETGKKSDGQATIEALSPAQRVELIEALRTSLNTDKARGGTRRKKQTNLVTITGSTDRGNSE